MRRENFAALVRVLSISALLTGVFALAGCGAGSPAVSTDLTGKALKGTAFGGQQPVVGATVTVWAAGSTGYGAGAGNGTTAGTPLASMTTGSNGGFGFAAGAYTCPTVNTPIYLTAKGGNPGNSVTVANPTGVNADILLVAMLGPCGSLEENSSTNIDEVTTLAAAYAFSGFINSTNFGTSSNVGIADAIGAPYSSTVTYATNTNNLTGMNNALKTYGNFVTNTTGTAPGSSANGTLETAKVNEMADILAACVNSDPTATSTCSTLFTEVSPTSSTSTPTASNTFEAAYYLATNPTSTNSSGSNIAAVYGTQQPVTPYQPMLGSAPTDWTVGINYAVSGFATGQRLAIDASGNVWVTSAGQLSELAPDGSVTVTYTGTQGSSTLTAPSGVAVDLHGNVLIADSGINQVLVFNSSGYVSAMAGSTSANQETYSLAIDLNNSAWVTSTNTNAVTATQNPLLLQCPYTSGAFCTSPTTSTATSAGPFGIALDQNSTIWLANAYINLSSATSIPGNIQSHKNTTGVTGNNYFGSASTKIYFPVGVVFDSGNRNLWYSNSAYAMTSTTTYGTSPTNSFLDSAPMTLNTYPTPDTVGTSPKQVLGGGLNLARYLAIDGNNNLWVANGDPCTSCATSTYSVSEFNDAGTALSPATTGFVHTMLSPNDVAIDGSGNVWVVSSSASANYVTELIGAATPAVTPIAYDTLYATWGERP